MYYINDFSILSVLTVYIETQQACRNETNKYTYIWNVNVLYNVLINLFKLFL